MSDARSRNRGRDLLRFTTAGSVDDGKSTLIGRLLFDSKQLLQDQIDELERLRLARGAAEPDLALITDGLRAEREQGITIDVAYRYFSTPRRKFIIADTPGHVHYTRNMVTGASTADLAVLLIDARNGVLTQSKRHAFISSLLGIPHLLVAVNKMDLVDYSEEVFQEISAEFTEFCGKLDVHDIVFIPISALNGDNIVDSSVRMPWYTGPTILYYLENVTIAADRNLVDFRFPVQYVLRPNQDFRGYAGRIASGRVQVGEEVIVLPSNRRTRISEIVACEFDREKGFRSRSLEEASVGQSVSLTMQDDLDISRGDMIVRPGNVAPMSNSVEAIICWMDERTSLNPATRYLVKHTSKVTQTHALRVIYRIDVDTLHRQEVQTLSLNEIGRVALTTIEPLMFDAYRNNRETGSIILIDPVTHNTVGAGMIRYERREEEPSSRPDDHSPAFEKKLEIAWETGLVTREDREHQSGHKAAVVWLTGLSGSGKSSIARLVERRLFESGARVVVIDGDNLRHGLCRDLGFSAKDRSENIRRAAEAAKLLFGAGNIVICSFISPLAADRKAARALFPTDRFFEVHVDCPIEECIRRDPKGLYRRAFSGEIPEFTGVSSPYEPPESPELRLDTEHSSTEVSAEEVLSILKESGIIAQ